MKCELLLLFLLTIATISNQQENPGQVGLTPNSNSKWVSTTTEHNGGQLKVVHYRGVDPRKIPNLILTVDKSMQSRRGGKGGLIQTNDVVCVSNKMIYWFSASPKGRRYVRSGGGLLAGMWEIKNDPKQGTFLKRIQNKSNYVKNLLYPGSFGKGFFGADVYGGYLGSNVIWGLEHSLNTRPTQKFGKDILNFERGAFASDEGVFIEFQGTLGNSRTGQGIESITDTDPRPGVIGETIYTLTYRIPANKNEIIQEVSFQAVKNNFGPINTAKLALYLPGHETNNMVYAANTELMKGGTISLNDVTINKYFKNSCEPKVYFYKVPFANQQTKSFATTSDGRGTLACIGSPRSRIPFVCAYPNNEFIPKVAYEDYTIELYDNQSIPRYGRFHGINYKLLKSPNKSYTLSQGKSLILIMRYKVIPAFVKLNSKRRVGDPIE